MSTNTLPQFPNITAPIALPNGQINPAWQQLFIQLWNQINTVQQTTASISSELETSSQDGALIVPPQTQIAVE